MVTGAGAFMAMLDSTIVNLALRTIENELSVPLASIQWVATAYLIALAASLPLSAWAARRYGSGRVWMASTTAFVLASALCALAPDLPMLVGARVLQGLAAGVMVPVGQAILGQVADRRQLGRLFGTVGFAVALGPALGPVVGGVMIDMLDWRWLFWINLPIGLAALGIASRVLPPARSEPAAAPDLLGLILIGGGLSVLLYGAGEGDPSLAALGAIVVALFVVRSLRIVDPLIDLRLFRSRAFTAALLIAASIGAAMYGGLLIIPLWLQDQQGLSPTLTGMMLMALGLGSAAALPFAGRLTDTKGAALVCLAGGALLVASTALVPLSGAFGVALIGVLLFVRGAGLALAQMPAMTVAYAAVGEGVKGDAATLLNMAQRVGGAIGAIVLVLFVGEGGAAYRPGFVAIIVLSVAPLILWRRLSVTTR